MHAKYTQEARRAEPRTYHHDGPTRSPVLNAFLHECGDMRLVAARVPARYERKLAPWLFERCRRYWASLLMADGKITASVCVMTTVPPITNEDAARRFLRLFANPKDGTELAAIARDYAAYYARRGSPEHDDLRARCIMAAFAGRLIDLAAQRLGPYVRDEIRAELQRLTADSTVPA